jgi:predicted dehydrogenase
MRPFRSAIVGFGSIADTLATDKKMQAHFRSISHAQAISEHPMFEFGAVLDPSGEARARATRTWGVNHLCATTKELLDKYDPEILVMTSPPTTRFEIIRSCRNLKGVFLEKPLGSDASAMDDWARTLNIPIQVNYWRRAVPDFIALAKTALVERIGRIQAAFGVYGNGLQNNGSHLIDFSRMLLGEVTSVRTTDKAKTVTRVGFLDDINVGFNLGFDGDLVMTAMPLDFAKYREVGIDIWGTNGRLAINQESLTMQFFPRVANRGLENEKEIASDQAELVRPKVSNVLDEMYENLYQAVVNKTPLLSSIESACRTEAIISAIEISARSGSTKITV